MFRAQTGGTGPGEASENAPLQGIVRAEQETMLSGPENRAQVARTDPRGALLQETLRTAQDRRLGRWTRRGATPRGATRRGAVSGGVAARGGVAAEGVVDGALRVGDRLLNGVDHRTAIDEVGALECRQLDAGAKLGKSIRAH